jgi:glutathione-regulated potassium-efflux system ancillary protein KefC
MYDLFWVGPALVAGLLAVRFGLPPLVGYLIAGFVLNAMGIDEYVKLSAIGELGVTLLLFTIGLKLDVRALLRPVIWAGTTLHMLITVAVFGTCLYWLSLAGVAFLADIDLGIALLIGFALSFSSTVFAVKVLEEKGAYTSGYGQLAIGVLIMQDIIAVVFLAASTGKLPSPWAVALFMVIPLRFVLMKMLDRVGHGELQILFGIAMAFGGWALFEVLDVKGDLGALIVGALLAAHPDAGGLSKKLLGFKDLLLVGFFLSIGMSGSISAAALLVALVLAVVVVFKVLMYFWLFTRFPLRARGSLFASLVLANYSEFGLIVGSIAVANGWLSSDWLMIIALALTMTFIAAAPLNARSRDVYGKFRARLVPFETQKTGHHVIHADATDDEFWERIGNERIRVVLLALPELEQNLGVTQRIGTAQGEVHVLAVVRYPEEDAALRAAGVKAVWNMHAEAGIGFAEEVMAYMGDANASDGGNNAPQTSPRPLPTGA